MKVLLANPRGFCAGVDRAIGIVDQALLVYGKPIYVKHELVHNDHVINSLRNKGVVFVDDVKGVPDGSVLIFSAHGVSKDVENEVRCRNLIVLDATCPLVKKVHMEVIRASNSDAEIIFIGHLGHPEVEGTMGQYQSESGGIYLVESVDAVSSLIVKDVNNLFYFTQTTLSVENTSKIVDALYKKFPLIKGPRKSDICYATINRQEAVRKMAINCDVVLVLGSSNSSNSNRLVELVKDMDKQVYLINDVNDIQEVWINDSCVVGITASASAPNILVDQVIKRLQKLSLKEFIVEELNVDRKENIVFTYPKLFYVF